MHRYTASWRRTHRLAARGGAATAVGGTQQHRSTLRLEVSPLGISSPWRHLAPALPLSFSQAPIAAALHHQRRHKSYVLKFLRGQLPADLKDVPGAIGCLYGTLPDVDEYGQMVLPLRVIQSYHQLGYVTLPHAVLDARQVDTLADEVNQLANNVEHHPKSEFLYATTLADLTGGPLFYCQGQWRASWGMHDLVYLPTITVPASQALGNSLVRLWYDEVFMKEARVGPCVPWQQHYARWQHTTPIRHVTVMIALDHLNKDRGAPCLIPGSHRWRDGGLLPSVPYDPRKDEAQQLNTIWDITNEEEAEVLMDSPPVTVDLRRGEALLIHPCTLFATHGNRSLSPARSCLVHYMGDGTTAAREGPLLPNTTRFNTGDKVEGIFHPVVFDPALTDEDIWPAQLTPTTDPTTAANGHQEGPETH